MDDVPGTNEWYTYVLDNVAEALERLAAMSRGAIASSVQA
jgi:hypothetical protein